MIIDSSAPPVKRKASECKTEEQVLSALLHLKEIKDTIQLNEQHNYQCRVESLMKKLDKFRPVKDMKIGNLFERDRIFYYHNCIILGVEFLKQEPDTKKLSELFLCLKEALKLTGTEWNEETMYSDLTCFGNAFTMGEKKVYFLNKILQSGLHEKRTIISIINYFIKLVNIMKISEELSISLPNKKTLHNLSFVELKY